MKTVYGTTGSRDLSSVSLLELESDVASVDEQVAERAPPVWLSRARRAGSAALVMLAMTGAAIGTSRAGSAADHAAAAHAATGAVSAATGDDAAAPALLLSLGEDDAASSSFEVKTITIEELSERPEVRSFLGRHNASGNFGKLSDYLPGKLVFKVWPERVAGSLGDDAADGLVAVNIKSTAGGSDWVASWLVVTTLTGELKHFAPTFVASFGENEEDTPHTTQMHTCALKPLKTAKNAESAGGAAGEGFGETYDGSWAERAGLVAAAGGSHTKLLLAGDNGTREAGPILTFDLETGDWDELGEGVTSNCHDVQWARGAGASALTSGAPAYWGPNQGGNEGVVLRSVASGDKLCTIDLSALVSDINHAQFVRNDSMIYISSRLSDAVVKVDISDACGSDDDKDDDGAIMSVIDEAVWTVGGDDGTFVIVDAQGAAHDPGFTLFDGQHNAEYFGTTASGFEEVMLMDNQFDYGDSTRLLVLHVDEANSVAYVDFEMDLHTHMPIYGDLDRLPSGNLLAVYTRGMERSIGPLQRDNSTTGPSVSDDDGGTDDADRTARDTDGRKAARAADDKSTSPASSHDMLAPIRLDRDDDGVDGVNGSLTRAAGYNPQFGLRVFEVVRETKEVAWQLDVIGSDCPFDDEMPGGGPLCLDNAWQAYSVERMCVVGSNARPARPCPRSSRVAPLGSGRFASRPLTRSSTVLRGRLTRLLLLADRLFAASPAQLPRAARRTRVARVHDELVRAQVDGRFADGRAALGDGLVLRALVHGVPVDQGAQRGGRALARHARRQRQRAHARRGHVRLPAALAGEQGSGPALRRRRDGARRLARRAHAARDQPLRRGHQQGARHRRVQLDAAGAMMRRRRARVVCAWRVGAWCRRPGEDGEQKATFLEGRDTNAPHV